MEAEAQNLRAEISLLYAETTEQDIETQVELLNDLWGRAEKLLAKIEKDQIVNVGLPLFFDLYEIEQQIAAAEQRTKAMYAQLDQELRGRTGNGWFGNFLREGIVHLTATERWSPKFTTELFNHRSDEDRLVYLFTFGFQENYQRIFSDEPYRAAVGASFLIPSRKVSMPAIVLGNGMMFQDYGIFSVPPGR